MHRDDGHHARIHYHDERLDGQDDRTRARLLAIWQTLGPRALAACCGGHGLVVGCPVCSRRR